VRTVLSAASVGLGLMLGSAMVASATFDLWNGALALALVGGGIRLWRRQQIRDEMPD
jgi:hypothetical protein